MGKGGRTVKKREKKEFTILEYKLLFTVLILLFYLVGRAIPLCGVDISAYTDQEMDAQTLLMQTISGDRYRSSLFALGISPYMMAGIVVQVYMALQNSDKKGKTSPKQTNRNMLALMLLIAVVQAVWRLDSLEFAVDSADLFLAKTAAAAEMVTGSFVILWLAENNKRYGIGGQTAMILVNILDGLMGTLEGATLKNLVLPLCVSAIVMVWVIVMENAEMRIPLQRISIHNIYADRNYLAFKLNPIGVMPVMFASAFFMLPQMAISAGLNFLPQNEELIKLSEKMTLNSPPGIITYLAILYFLTIGFTMVFINPGDLTEQFLKSGDSIIGLHPGKDTKRYLVWTLFKISFVSATMMAVCLGVPMCLQYYNKMDSSLAMLPSSVMILTGIWCNLYQEIVSVKNLDAYKPFI
jgi:preprotein translocase subunit SecY